MLKLNASILFKENSSLVSSNIRRTSSFSKLSIEWKSLSKDSVWKCSHVLLKHFLMTPSPPAKVPSNIPSYSLL